MQARKTRVLLHIWLGSILASSTASAWAQLGQSELIDPNAGQTAQQQDAQPGLSNLMSPGTSVRSEMDLNNINPGKGWMPPRRFQSMDATAASSVQPQQPQQPQAQWQTAAPAAAADDGSMPWQDLPRRKPAAPQQWSPPQAGAAFQAGSTTVEDAWSLPSAQQQQDLGWAQNLPAVPMSAVTPPSSAGRQQAPSPTAAPASASSAFPVAQAGSFNANVPQPTTQFDPGNFPSPPMRGRAQYNQPPQQSTGMAGFAPMPAPYQPPQQATGMPGFPPMSTAPNSAMPTGSMGMGTIGSGMPAGNGGYGMMMSDVAPPGTMPPVGGMSPSAQAQMQPFASMLGLTNSSGGMSSPFDAIGKAIAGAAQMGLIPSASGIRTQPPPGMYNQMPAYPTNTYPPSPYAPNPYGQPAYNQQMPPMPMAQQNPLNNLMNVLPGMFGGH